jgi:ZIP family zinc transporter
MLTAMLEAAAWALFAAASLLLGAVIAQTFDVSERVIGSAMGFGAGALISAVAYDLIPQERVSHSDIWLSFAIGATVFYAIDGVLEHRSAGAANSGQAIALGALLDGIPESMVLGIGLAVGGSISIGFLVAVFVSNVPEALSATSELRTHVAARAIYRLWITITIASGIAGALGYAVTSALPSADGHRIEAFAAGAVLTMLASSMMPEAFVKGGRRVAIFTALGFAVAAVLTVFE